MANRHAGKYVVTFTIEIDDNDGCIDPAKWGWDETSIKALRGDTRLAGILNESTTLKQYKPTFVGVQKIEEIEL